MVNGKPPGRKPQTKRKKTATARKTGRLRGKGARAPQAESGAGKGRQDKQPPEAALERECRKLIALVRERCPGLLPSDPVPAGEVAAPLQVRSREVGALVTVAARQSVLDAIGAPIPSDPNALPSSVLWQEGPDALMIDVGRIDVRVDAGLVTVAIPVACDQLPRGRAVVEVDFVVGTPERPAGLLAAATEPRGPRVIIRRWAEPLTALAWQSVLGAIGGVAAAAGIDRDGAPLIPTALSATRAGFDLVVQARHEIDRIKPGRVVTPRPSFRKARP
jgi:hypothetical protein